MLVMQRKESKWIVGSNRHKLVVTSQSKEWCDRRHLTALSTRSSEWVKEGFWYEKGMEVGNSGGHWGNARKSGCQSGKHISGNHEQGGWKERLILVSSHALPGSLTFILKAVGAVD